MRSEERGTPHRTIKLELDPPTPTQGRKSVPDIDHTPNKRILNYLEKTLDGFWKKVPFFDLWCTNSINAPLWAEKGSKWSYLGCFAAQIDIKSSPIALRILWEVRWSPGDVPQILQRDWRRFDTDLGRKTPKKWPFWAYFSLHRVKSQICTRQIENWFFSKSNKSFFQII